MREFRGIGIGRTAATGQVFRWIRPEGLEDERRSLKSVANEAQSLREGIARAAALSRNQSADADAHTREIIDALLMIIEDDELLAMAQPFLEQGWDAATALFRALDEFSLMMGDDEDFQSRVSDLRGIALNVSASTRGIASNPGVPENGAWVVVADDLTPVDTAQFGPSVVGVVTEGGGATSHTAIICRARGIPAVVGVKGALELESETSVLVDPAGHRVVVGADIADATTPIAFVAQHEQPLVTVRANIGSLEDAVAAAKTAARGVGLFRTEVLYLGRRDRPSRAAQAEHFRSVFAAAPAGKITVRTIDAGSDKPVAFLDGGKEENPALGVRGFRLGALHSDFQCDQLGAIRDAIDATGRDVQVMAPMISTVDEAVAFRAMAADVGLTEIGIMVETPAIVPMVSNLGGVVDFLSIGTNDLSQYLFAADRMNSALSDLVDPWQPALIRTIQQLMSYAQTQSIPVGVCGEAAADPLFAVVLAGLGVSSVSVAPAAVESVREALCAVSQSDAVAIAQAVSAEVSAHSARGLAERLVREVTGA